MCRNSKKVSGICCFSCFLSFFFHLNLLSRSPSVPCVLSVEGVLNPGSAAEVCAEWAQNSNTSGIFFPLLKGFSPLSPTLAHPLFLWFLRSTHYTPPPHPSVTGTRWHTLTTWDMRGPRTLKEQDAFQRRSVLGCSAERPGW